MLFNDWLNLWITEYQTTVLKNSTLESDLQRIEQRIKPFFVKRRLIDMKPELIQKFYNSLQITPTKRNPDGLSPATVKKYHNMIRKALQQAYINNLIHSNPCDKVKLPTIEKKEVECFSIEEQKQFITAVSGSRLETAFILLLYTGLRRGELLGLKWVDYDDKTGNINIARGLYHKAIVKNGKRGKAEFYFDTPKTDFSKRTIPLPPALMELLKKHRKEQLQERLLAGKAYQDHGMIFCNEVGEYIHPHTFSRTYNNILKRNNIRHVKLHGLRHAFATRLLEQGASMKHVQILLGHAKMETTANIYSHVSEIEKRKTMELLSESLL